MAIKRLVLEVSAAVQGAIRDLGKVKDSVVELAEATAEVGKRAGSGLTSAFSAVGKGMDQISDAFGKVTEIGRTLVDLSNFAGEREILRAAVSPETLQGLRAASQGLVDDTNLMRIAAVAMRGDMALTQEQMTTLTQAAVALHQQGFGPVPEIVERLAEAMRKGKTGMLDDFGIVVDGAFKVQDAWEAIGKKAREASDEQTNSGDRATRAMVALKRIWDQLKELAGNLAGAILGALAPALERLADTLDWVRDHTIGVVDALRDLVTSQVDAAAGADRLNNPVTVMAEKFADAGISVFKTKQEVVALDFEMEQLAQTIIGMGKTVADFTTEIVITDDEVVKFIEKRRREHDEMIRRRQKAWQDEIRMLGELGQAGKAWADQIEREKDLRDEQIARELQVRDIFRDVALERLELEEQIAAVMRQAQSDRVAGMTAEIQLASRTAEANARQIAQYRSFSGALKSFAEQGKGALQALGDEAGKAFFLLISGQRESIGSLSEIFDTLLEQFGLQMQLEALKSFGMALRDQFWNPAAAAGEWASYAVFQGAALLAGAGAAVVDSGGGGGAAASAGVSGGAANTAGRDSVLVGANPGNAPIHIEIKIGQRVGGDDKALARELNKAIQDGIAQGTVRPDRGWRRI